MNKNFREVIESYQTILVDNYGVLKFANGLNFEAVETLKELISLGKTVIILSNGTFTDPEERFAQKGLFKGVHYHAFVTSGQYAKEDISKGALPFGKKCYVFGTANFKRPDNKVPDLLAGTPYECVDSADIADFVYCGIPQVAGEDRTTIADFVSPVRDLLRRGLPMVVANPDELACEDGRWVVRQGAIADLYRKLGGDVKMYGKPDPGIFDWVLGDIPRDQVLMVGDSLPTDILGAKNAGIASCLTVSGGLTEAKMRQIGFPTDPAGIKDYIKYSGSPRPDYIIPSIF